MSPNSPLHFILVLLGLVVLTSACQRRSATSAEQLPPRKSASSIIEQVEQRLYTPQQVELKGQLQLEGESIQNLRLNAIVRLKGDSIVWFSLRKLGFEGARGLLTRDSIVILNRLEREALIASSADLPEQAKNLPIEPRVENFAAAFGGRLVGDWSDAEVERLPGQYQLKSQSYPGAMLVVDAVAFTASKWVYQDEEQYAEILFDDFRPQSKGQWFPFRREIKLVQKEGDTTQIRLTFESLSESESLSFPMSIPGDYAPMEF